MSKVLEVEGLEAGYGAATVLRDVSLHVEQGEVVVVLGANGAGKTTLMRAISGLLPFEGSISLDGQPTRKDSPDTLVRRGLSLIPQGRGTISALTVEDNLKVGAVTRKDRNAVAADIDTWYQIFPRLCERRRQVSATLSGGEQQMLALARAMMSRPRLLMCDEASLGLAPLITKEIFAQLRLANERDGLALLLVEQNAALALELASRVYVMSVGEVVSSGPAVEYADDDAIRTAYLGL